MRRAILPFVAMIGAICAMAPDVHSQAMTEAKLRTLRILPDPALTPGEVNPAITQSNIAETICNKAWSTGSVRDTVSSEEQKAKTYLTYHIPHPTNNTGQNQTCELDHLISIENGGGDGLRPWRGGLHLNLGHGRSKPL